jgi:hypothetical protein
VDDDDDSLHLFKSAQGHAPKTRADAGDIGIRRGLYTIPQGFSTLKGRPGLPRLTDGGRMITGKRNEELRREAPIDAAARRAKHLRHPIQFGNKVLTRITNPPRARDGLSKRQPFIPHA